MSNLEIAGVLLRLLRVKLGMSLVIAGGSARDTWHGQEPKDFDIFVLNGDAESEDVDDIANSVYYKLKDIPDVAGVNVYTTYREQRGSHIAWVIKFNYWGLKFDLIEFMECITTEGEQVENFSSTLDMAYFTEDQQGELVVVTHPEFNEVVTGVSPVRHLSTCDGDVNSRLKYLQEKYPQYTYAFLPEKPCQVQPKLDLE